MRTRLWLGAAAILLGLAGTGIAVAAKRDEGTAAVAFAFTAAANDVTTRTCVGADGTYRLTRATYRNGAIAEGRYAGATATVRLHTTVKNGEIGLARGRLTIRDGDRLEASGALLGVVSGVSLSGVIVGRDRRGEDRGHLLANFSATIGSDDLRLVAGAESGPNTAVVFGGTGCGRKERPSLAVGEVTALTDTSITVKTPQGEVTCSLTASQAARLRERVQAGDRVAVRCSAGGKLLKIRLKE